jgi:iron complex outermembrane receptor protein
VTKLTKSALYITTALGLGFVSPAAIPSVHAQSAAATNGQAAPLEEIVVTARRVEERLQEVPISITVLNQQQLTNRNIATAGDLGNYVPSLSVNAEFGANNVSFAIRGFVQALQTSASVGTYFAHVVAPRGGPSTTTGDVVPPGTFFDLENVQVLKGPQGTLFGRNTTGGAVLLVPKKPTPNYEGYLELSGGNYSMERVQGVLNVPLGEKVRIRLGLDQQTRDGYLENISGIGPKDFNDIDYVNGRASMIVDVTDDIENYTIGTYSHSDIHGTVSQVFACNPTAPIFGQMSCDQLARDRAASGGNHYYVDNAIPNPFSYNQEWQVINTTTWQATDDLTVKNIASYSELTAGFSSTIFGTNWIIPKDFFVPFNGHILALPTGKYAGLPVFFTDSVPTPGYPVTNQSSFTEELQFQGRALGDALRWQAGVYLEGSHPLGYAGPRSAGQISCSDVDALQCTDVLGALLAHKVNGFVQQALGTISYQNLGVYSQVDYNLTEQLKLEAGVRFTNDITTGYARRLHWDFPSPNTPVMSCQTGLDNSASGCGHGYHSGSRAPTAVVDLEYKPIDDVMTYAKWARGYRQGGISETAFDAFNTFRPEQVDTYEVGAKTSFHGDISGTFDAAAFYNDFTNQQLVVGAFSNQGSPASGIINAGSSRIWGLELEGLLVPAQGVTLDLAYTYLNTKIETLAFPAPPGVTVIPSAQVGDPLPFTPRHKLSFAATYALPLDESIGKVMVGATYVYNGSQIVQSGGPYAYLPAYSLLNFNVNWESIFGGPVDAEFFMTNATDTFYLNYIADYSVIGLGFADRNPGEPRMFGGRLRYRFGGGSGS